MGVVSQCCYAYDRGSSEGEQCFVVAVVGESATARVKKACVSGDPKEHEGGDDRSDSVDYCPGGAAWQQQSDLKRYRETFYSKVEALAFLGTVEFPLYAAAFVCNRTSATAEVAVER